MAVGFDRYLRRIWLDRTLELAAFGVQPVTGRSVLFDELETEIRGAKSRRETTNRLVRIWLSPDLSLEDLRRWAIELHARGFDALALHWGMTAAAYPFFGTVAETVGRQLRMSGHCDPALVRRRVAAVLGERTTALRAADRVLQSMIDWDVLSRARGGRFQESYVTVVPPELSAWLAVATLYASGTISRSLDSLAASPGLFPFVLSPFGVTDTAGQAELLRLGGHREMVVLTSAL